jgi:predicted dehydrogenase
MAKLLRSHRVVFGVHHQKRYIPTFLIAREYVRQRKLGDVVAIEVDYIHSMKSRATAYDDWRIDPINPQNVVLGAMSHSFDLINWILDEQPKTLCSMAGHEGWKDYPENDTNMTILQYGSGVIAKACSTISSSGFQKERLAIYGTEGQIHNNLFIDSLCKSHLIVKPKESLGIKQRLFSPILKYTNPAEYPYSINEHDRACQDLLNEFVRCIRTDSPFSVCFSSSHQVISLCLKAIESYRTGKTIDLKTL